MTRKIASRRNLRIGTTKNKYVHQKENRNSHENSQTWNCEEDSQNRNHDKNKYAQKKENWDGRQRSDRYDKK